MLREMGLTTFKIASSESGSRWWNVQSHERWLLSWPWGQQSCPDIQKLYTNRTHLTAIPLYPTPLECVGKALLLDGWSDHVIGLDACYWALAQGAKVLEVHMRLDGYGRECAWDKTPAEIRELRRFADNMETIRTGVKTQFRERWTHGA